MRKRYIDPGRGLALLALRPSEKLKKGVLGRIPCITVAVRIIIMTIGGSLVQTPARNLSNPTDSVADVPDCLARLGIELDELPQSLKASQLGHRLTFLQIRWALRSCQCGERVDDVAFSS